MWTFWHPCRFVHTGVGVVGWGWGRSVANSVKVLFFFFLVVVWSAGPYNLPDFVQSVESLKNLKGISLMAREEAVQTHNPESASVKTVEKEGGEPSVEPPWSSHVGSSPPPPPPPPSPFQCLSTPWLAGRHRAVCLSYLLLYIHDSWSSTPTLVNVRWCLQHVYTVWCLNRLRRPLPPSTRLNYLEWCPGFPPPPPPPPPPRPPPPFFHLQSCKLWLPVTILPCPRDLREWG